MQRPKSRAPSGSLRKGVLGLLGSPGGGARSKSWTEPPQAPLGPSPAAAWEWARPGRPDARPPRGWSKGAREGGGGPIRRSTARGDPTRRGPHLPGGRADVRLHSPDARGAPSRGWCTAAEGPPRPPPHQRGSVHLRGAGRPWVHEDKAARARAASAPRRRRGGHGAGSGAPTLGLCRGLPVGVQWGTGARSALRPRVAADQAHRPFRYEPAAQASG